MRRLQSAVDCNYFRYGIHYPGLL